MTLRLTIDHLGAQGDGVCEVAGKAVFVPFTLSGERVAAEILGSRGTLVEIEQASLDRVSPVCRHFGVCGGCVLQHLAEAPYHQWKRGLVVKALKTGGVDAPVADLIPGAPGTRRRVTLSARREGGSLALGYNRKVSNDVVAISECPIAVPAVTTALEQLRPVAELLCPSKGDLRLTVTATGTGLDVVASGGGPASEEKRRAAGRLALAANLARLSLNGEVLIEPGKPILRFGAAAVVMPPAAFVQATAAAEDAMADLVCGHLGKSKRVADLFAGLGTFALRLAQKSEVHAVESDPAALAALGHATRGALNLRQVTAERRDLFRRPLTSKELERFDGLVFDPPRAGAEDQAKHIARSSVAKVAAVSCNPTTLARDLRILLDGGYAIDAITPIDQFLWSPHVEVVALLTKSKKSVR